MTTVDIADAASGGGVYTIPGQSGSGSGGSTGSSSGGSGDSQSSGGTVSGNSPGTNATTNSSSGSNPPGSALTNPSSPRIVCHVRVPTGRLLRGAAGDRGKAASLALYVSCDQPASFSLAGTVKISVDTPKRTYALANKRGNTRASGETKLIVLIPHVVLVAMNHHARASVSFTLTAKASSSDITARTNIVLR
jgi:hypothetical protein